MSHESEQALENKLVKQLVSLGYAKVEVKDEMALLANLKTQLEKHNKTTFTDAEFEKIKIHLNKGNVFDRAKILRDRFSFKGSDGKQKYIEFINQNEWCKNEYQVTQQITQDGRYKTRYDVTLLINGFPLVQIELKRRGLGIKEAFNQINRYDKHGFEAGIGLFRYVQLFVISNGKNTKYYANNAKQSFKQTFFWADKHNKTINELEAFANSFLDKCHISKIITKYIVLNETNKILMVLRPYQYFAVEAIVHRVEHGRNNGYIWHTTGSGKTLTSFKAAQILIDIPKVHKVVFVVDRRDLDDQTNREFNAFSPDSVNGTDDTKSLVKQFNDDTKLIITTIQKLNNAITRDNYKHQMEGQRDKRIVFIFDECHRSQFGKTHNAITEFFSRNQMFGFTGTPIFEDNAAKNDLGKRSTKDLFGERLHEYVITDAIRDENVLKFSIEYVGKYKEREGTESFKDIEVEAIDTKELMESNKRLEPITEYIIDNHSRKTHNRAFNAMFCVSSVEVLTKYYDLFAAKKLAGVHKLKIATIFSFNANEDDKNANGILDENDGMDIENMKVNQHSRDILEGYIQDYNQMFGTNYTTKDSKSFYNYYRNIAKRTKAKEIDILLVVNMFLTGFDAPQLNTLYVDKNLKYHGLIQAFSRTNRILNEKKSQGNIICFRNLKKHTDEAVTLFSNKNASEVIFVEPYEDYVRKFNSGVEHLLTIAPTVQSVAELQSEEDELAFVKAFRELMRHMNILISFTNFSFDDLAMNNQMYEDYKSKYLDLAQKVRSDNELEKVSILDDVDFELELLHRDEINVAYILSLLAQLKDTDGKDAEGQRKAIMDIISSDAELRNKRELIEKFILENMPNIGSSQSVEEEFSKFWTAEKSAAIQKICKDQGLKVEQVEQIITDYNFTNREPTSSDIVNSMVEKPKLMARQSLIDKATSKIMNFIDVYIIGAPDS